MIRALAPLLLVLSASPYASLAQEPTERTTPTARDTIERAIEAHGGEGWLDPKTLILSGEAEFYDPKTGAVRSRATDYRMWREFQRGRKVAHGADGKVRILARNETRTIFEVGYDGQTTWTQNGIMPQVEADAYWANNFGFGIIRSALDDGFSLERAPARYIDGHDVDLIRVIDPLGQATLFGIDIESGFVRYMAFDSPRGFHERHYHAFVRLPDNGWVQSTKVTLFYDGVKSNTVFWREIAVGQAIDPAVFSPPQEDTP